MKTNELIFSESKRKDNLGAVLIDSVPFCIKQCMLLTTEHVLHTCISLQAFQFF